VALAPTSCTSFGDEPPDGDSGGGAEAAVDSASPDIASEDGARFCNGKGAATGVMRCWDFDDPSDPFAGFDGRVTIDGTLEVVADDVAGSNRVMRVSVLDKPVGRSVYAYRSLGTRAELRSYELSFRFQVRQSAVESAYLGVFLAHFAIATGPPLGAASYGAANDLGGVPNSAGSKTLRGAADKSWHRAVITVRAQPFGGSVSIDGVVVHDGPVSTTAGPNLGAYIGAIYLNDKGGALDVRFDDILLREL